MFFSLQIYQLLVMLGAEMESLSSNAVVLESVLHSAMEAMVVETAIVVTNSICWFLSTMGAIANGINVLHKEPSIFGRFPFAELHAMKKCGPENKDGSDTEDDEKDDDDAAADDQDDDADEEEDGSGEEGEDEGDPEDEPEANGDGGSGDEDDEDEDDDEDDGEEEEEEEEEEDEEDEEEIPQPPTKKRK